MKLLELFIHLTKPFRKKGLGEIPGARALHDKIFKFLRPRELSIVQIHGNLNIWVDPRDSGEAPQLLLGTGFEEFESEIIKSYVKANMIALDIGAHIGYFTVFLASLVGKEGIVHAFEPELGNFKMLKRNIGLNGLQNVITHNYALSDREGKSQLFIDNSNLGNMSLGRKNIPSGSFGGFVEVSTKVLDYELPGIAPDFVKIDVQGAEALVLAGAEKSILSSPNVQIMMEFWPHGLKTIGSDPLKFLKDISNRGFALNIIDVHRKILKDSTPEKIIGISKNRPEEKGWVNLWLKRK